MNHARNMHTASNLYIKMAAPGWLFSCNTSINAPRKSYPARLMCSGPYWELYCHAVCTWKLWNLLFSWFVYERNRLDLIKPRVLKISVTHAVCTWRCWTNGLFPVYGSKVKEGNFLLYLGDAQIITMLDSKRWYPYDRFERLKWKYVTQLL